MGSVTERQSDPVAVRRTRLAEQGSSSSSFMSCRYRCEGWSLDEQVQWGAGGTAVSPPDGKWTGNVIMPERHRLAQKRAGARSNSQTWSMYEEVEEIRATNLLQSSPWKNCPLRYFCWDLNRQVGALAEEFVKWHEIWYSHAVEILQPAQDVLTEFTVLFRGSNSMIKASQDYRMRRINICQSSSPQNCFLVKFKNAPLHGFSAWVLSNSSGLQWITVYFGLLDPGEHGDSICILTRTYGVLRTIL